MTTQNMKLLDLQTGKYLELGKDWVYGGEHIIVSKCNIGYEVYEAIQHNNSEKLYAYDNDCLITEELNEPLKALCEETGAVIYGARYVLMTKHYNIQIGDLWKNSNYYNILVACINYKNNIHFKHNISGGSKSAFEQIKNDNNDNLIVRCSQNENSEFLGNIFEECSKQLRNEPNKFDELNQHFK